MTPGKRFRQLLGSGIVTLPGVFNAITAKLAAAAGFDALYMTGAGVANSLTAMPDIGLVTLSEVVQQARYISTAANPIPVIADADTGFGDVLSVVRTVQELEHAGLAGIHLEDQVAPKRCGHLDGKQVISTVDMAKKIDAAVHTRTDPDFFIIARTDSRSIEGIENAIKRAKRYLDAGADAIFPESLQSVNEFARFAKEIDAPLLANMTEFGKTPLITAKQFEDMGYAMVIFPMTAFRVMAKAAQELYTELKRSGTQADFIDRMQTRAELYDLIDYESYKTLDHDISERHTKE
jgi:methylisocitrate lyase